MIDGATRGQILRKIILPLSAQGMVAVAVFVIVYAWNEFLFAFIFTTTRAKTAPLVMSEMIGAVEGVEWGVLFAASTVQLLPDSALRRPGAEAPRGRPYRRRDEGMTTHVPPQNSRCSACPPAPSATWPIPRSAASIRCRASSPSTISIAAFAAGRSSSAITRTRLDAMLPGYAQHTRAMLSTLPHWDFGVAWRHRRHLRPEDRDAAGRGAQNVAIKRLTFRKRGPIRFECYFTFKPEATELKLLGNRRPLVRLPLRSPGRRPGAMAASA